MDSVVHGVAETQTRLSNFHSLFTHTHKELRSRICVAWPETKHLVPTGTLPCFLPTLQPQTTTTVLAVSIDLPILGISYKWKDMICGPL